MKSMRWWIGLAGAVAVWGAATAHAAEGAHRFGGGVNYW